MTPSPLRKGYEALGAVFGALAVITQLAISLPTMLANGWSLAGALVQFFSFFTILSNIAAVLFYLATLLNWNVPPLRAATWQTAMALYIAIVACVYIAVLQDIWDPQGIFRLLDISLHYVTPALFVFYWLVFTPKGETAYADAWKWLVPGLAYVIYALARGALTGLYPYPFLDAGTLGYGRVALNVLLLLLFFFALSLVMVTIDHALRLTRR